MHWLDAISARALARTPPHKRVFRRGWGDPDALAAYLAESAATVPIPGLEITEGAEQTWDGLVGRDLVFESPGRYLPEASRLARARLVGPPSGTDRAVVLMASWNDHGYAGRAKLAADLAARGIASAMLEQPFYGERRAYPGDEQPIATVADFMWMGRSAVLEGRVLADHLRRQGYRVGVSGYSMGGNMAGFLAAAMPFPVATALLAAPFSPGPPFLHGILRTTIAWEALGGDTSEVAGPSQRGTPQRQRAPLPRPAPHPGGGAGGGDAGRLRAHRRRPGRPPPLARVGIGVGQRGPRLAALVPPRPPGGGGGPVLREAGRGQ